MVRVRVLGALEARVGVDGRDVVADLGGPRQRAVLALLLVGRGEVVSVDRLVEDLWNSEPPPRAIGALQAYVSHLRRALEPGRRPRTPATVLVSEPPGYAVRLPVDAVDAWRFEAMVRTAATVDDPEEARSTLEQALALWRGPAYAEAAGEAWAVAEAARLEGLRLVARERWCAAVLRTGAADDAVLAAEMLTREHPLREEGWRLLALALYASGRQSDALAALRSAREILAEEMGLDPGPVLVQLESDVLSQQLTIEPPPGRRPRGASPTPDLRADPPASVGPPGSVRTTANPAAAGEATPGLTAVPKVTEGVTGTPMDPVAIPPVIDPTPPGRATRPIAGGEFVGRDAELNALHAAAGDAADHGALRVALLAGDPGAGKTTILDRLTGNLVRLGWRVAVGRCPEAAGAPPAWAWVETLRSLTADVDPGPLAPALAPLLDERLAAAQQSDASFGRFLLQRAVSSYLTTAANHRPLAIVLDDLHRGDSETLSLLGALADTVTGVPLLLIGSYRPSEVIGELRDTLAGLARHSPVRLMLGGLEPDQAARLIRTVAGVQPDEATLAAITDRTGGNPFYLVESARLLGSEGTLVATSRVPEGVRDVLRRRLARLPEISVSVLRLAAVIGRDVDVDVLARAAEVDEETVIDALEVGVLAGLLTEPAPGAVRFAHVLVRDTLYGDVPRVRLSRWHARVAAALTSVQPGDAAALAYHFHQAGTQATARQAVDAGVLAAEQAVARYAHDTAVEMYAQALIDLDRVPPPAPGSADDPAGAERLLAERVRLLARLSRSQLTAGAGVDALTSRGRALSLADEAGRDDLVIRVLTAWDLPTPWLNRQYGSIDTGVTALIERCLRADDLDDQTRCRLLCALVSEISGEDHDRALTAATEAESLARRAADPVLIGLSLHALGAVILADLEPDRRQRIAEELIEIGGRPGLAVFALIGHLGAAQVAGARVDLDGASEQTELAAVLVERYRWRQSRGIVAMNRGMLAHIAGDLDVAEQLYAQGGELIRRSGAVDADGIIAVAWMTLRITQGRVGELESTIRDTGSAADVERDLQALSLAAQGRVAEARELRRGIRPVRRDFFRSLFLTMRAMTVSALAERSEAASVYTELCDYQGQISGAGGSAFALGPVDTALGDLALLLGRREAAVAHYTAGLELARRCGSAPWTAVAQDKLARLSVAS